MYVSMCASVCNNVTWFESIMKQAYMTANITAVFYMIPYTIKTKQPLIEIFKKAHLLHHFNIFK